MVEPVSITSLAITGIAIISYLSKKAIKRMNNKGSIQSNCGIELSDVIQNTKIEIINELKEFLSTELKNMNENKKIHVEREPTNI